MTRSRRPVPLPCPFCGRERVYYVSPHTGRRKPVCWPCKKRYNAAWAEARREARDGLTERERYYRARASKRLPLFDGSPFLPGGASGA